MGPYDARVSSIGRGPGTPPHRPVTGGDEPERSAETSHVPAFGREIWASTTSHSNFPFPFVSSPWSDPAPPAEAMRAWTPQAAPPVSIAIVRRSPIVRVVQIIVPPTSAEAEGTIGPSFSFG